MLGWLRRLGRYLARSYERPSIPLTGDLDDDHPFLGGGRSGAGIAVNETTALRHGPVYRAVNLIARDIARVRLEPRRNQGSGSIPDRRHPLYRLLRREPYPGQSAIVWKMLVMVDWLLWGNHYSFVERDDIGRPRVVIRIAPQLVEPRRTDLGELLYLVKVEGSPARRVIASDMIHCRGIGDGDTGYNVIKLARDSIGLGIAARRHGEYFFARGARPTISLETSEDLGEEGGRRTREDFARRYGGLEKQHIPIVLDNGMKMNAFSTSNEDAQFLESREFDLIEISHWFGVPPSKLGHTAKTSYSSLEQENQSYLDSLDPWMTVIEEELELKLLSEEERETHTIAFARDQLIRPDTMAQGEYFSKAISGGWMSQDEARAQKNLPPIPGGLGKRFFVPANLILAEDIGKKPEPAPAPLAAAAAGGTGEEDDDELEDEEENRSRAAQALLEQLVDRAASRLGIQAQKRSRSAEKFRSWLESELEPKNRDALREQARPVLETAAKVLGRSATPARDWVDDLLAAFRAALEPAAQIEDDGERRAAIDAAIAKFRGSRAALANHHLELV